MGLSVMNETAAKIRDSDVTAESASIASDVSARVSPRTDSSVLAEPEVQLPADNGQSGAELESGLESEDNEESEITKPFSPEKIKTRTTPIIVNLIVQRIEHEEIDLKPDFQRQDNIWTCPRKSRFIESLLLRIPIPVFYVAESEDEKWVVVDGLQRTTTIYGYVTGQFQLQGLEYLKRLNGKKYGDLPRHMRRRIDETQLVVNIIEWGTPKEVMFNIFRRINTGGVSLNGQEIRHALHSGPVLEYLESLAVSEEFLQATDRSISPNRMGDRECVLRFLSFFINPWENYSERSFDSHLSRTMRQLNDMSPEEREELTTAFKKAMQAAADIFGREAFRKWRSGDKNRRPVNKPLFETWSVGLARCSKEQIGVLVEGRESIQSHFRILLSNDSDFHQAITSSTGGATSIKKRFQAIQSLIQGHL